MTWENLEGGQESSQHSGEAYRQQVQEYLEAGEFHAIDDDYAGTSDITLVRPAHNEEKEFRVETKHTKLGRTNQAFIDELDRQFIDFHRGDTEFEFYVFAADYASQQTWKDIFHDRIRKEEAVRDFYNRICEDHDLNEDEAEQLEELDFDDFWTFLEKVAVKKAGYERLGQLIDDRESKERRKKKWEFYVRENEPVKKPGKIIPNCLRIANSPNFIWILPGLAQNHHDVREENPGYLPVWFTGGEAYSLIDPDEMRDSLQKYVDVDGAARHEFTEWRSQNSAVRRRAITLLNYQLIWRGAKQRNRSRAVRHDGSYKLIFQTSERFGTTQRTLAGDIADDRRDEKVDGYVVLKDFGSAIAHRYAEPRVKRYGDEYYAFLTTGWLFTRHGNGDTVIKEDEAEELHNRLEKQNLERVTNKRSQFRQWRSHFGANQEMQGEGQFDTLDAPQRTQQMQLEALSFELRERPPKNVEEREQLMEGRRVE